MRLFSLSSGVSLLCRSPQNKQKNQLYLYRGQLPFLLLEEHLESTYRCWLQKAAVRLERNLSRLQPSVQLLL